MKGCEEPGYQHNAHFNTGRMKSTRVDELKRTLYVCIIREHSR